MARRYKRVCIIEDNTELADAMQEFAQNAWPDSPVRCTLCNDIKEALAELVRVRFDVITLDLFLPYLSGLPALSLVHGFAPVTPIIICSGALPSIDHMEEYGVRAVLQKPFTMAEYTETLVRVAAEGRTMMAESTEIDSVELVSSGVLSYRLLYNVFLDATDAILITDGSLILGVNKQVPLLFGYHVSELLNRSIEILVPDDKRDQHSKYRLDYNKQPRYRMMGPMLDLYGQHKDGHLFPIEVNLSPFMELSGLRVVATIRQRLLPGSVNP